MRGCERASRVESVCFVDGPLHPVAALGDPLPPCVEPAMSAARQQKTVRPTLDIVTARILTPAWLLFLLGLQITDGTTNALPVWLRNLSVQTGAEVEVVLRVLMSVEILFAGTMLLFPRIARGVALATLLILCFSAIASISADPGDRGGVLLHAIILIVATLLLIGLRSTHPRPTLPKPPLVLSAQWRVMGMILVVTIAGAIGARIDIRPTEVPIRPPQAPVVEFDLTGWLNMPISQIALREYVPMLTARTMTGERIVVFYSGNCSSCHELFAEHWSGRLEIPVIAVRIPPPPDAPMVPSDQPDSVDCHECEFMQLRPGPLYLVQPPVVFRVSDGVIRCIADSRDPAACLPR